MINDFHILNTVRNNLQFLFFCDTILVFFFFISGKLKKLAGKSEVFSNNDILQNEEQDETGCHLEIPFTNYHNEHVCCV